MALKIIFRKGTALVRIRTNPNIPQKFLYIKTPTKHFALPLDWIENYTNFPPAIILKECVTVEERTSGDSKELVFRMNQEEYSISASAVLEVVKENTGEAVWPPPPPKNPRRGFKWL